MFFYDGTFLLNWRWEIVGKLAECFSESFKLDEGPKKSAKELKKLWLIEGFFFLGFMVKEKMACDSTKISPLG